MTRLRLRRIFWIGAAAILVVAALVALVAVLRGSFSDDDARILLTLGAVLFAGSAAFAGLALLDRGRARRLAWGVVVLAPVGLALMIWPLWSFSFEEGDRTADKLAWSAVVAIGWALVATTALLFARRRELVRLAALAGTLGALAAGLSIVGVWTAPDADAYPKLLGALLILTVLCYLLVPVLQRFASAEAVSTEVRVLGVLDGVELVAARGEVEGILADPPLRGERLALRRRS